MEQIFERDRGQCSHNLYLMDAFSLSLSFQCRAGAVPVTDRLLSNERRSSFVEITNVIFCSTTLTGELLGDLSRIHVVSFDSYSPKISI